MFKLTTFDPPFVHYQCTCKRQWIGDEMYMCNSCNKGICRFCLHEEEIEVFYCRFCLDTQSKHDAQMQNNHCIRHLQCPICFSVLAITLSPGRDRFFYYVCHFCKWDSTTFNYHAKSINGFLAKIAYYKGLYMHSPQQFTYQRLVKVLMWNIEQQNTADK